LIEAQLGWVERFIHRLEDMDSAKDGAEGSPLPSAEA
jgi:hypothetical protein